MKTKILKNLWIFTVSLFLVMSSGVGNAAFPGTNGKIVLNSNSIDSQLLLINTDGSGLETISIHPQRFDVKVSPDASKILFWAFTPFINQDGDPRGTVRIYTLSTGMVQVRNN